MLIHSAVITGSVQLNNTDVSSITNVAGFATTASVDSLVVKTGSYATTSSVNNLQSVTGSYATTSSFGAYTSSNDTTNTTQNTRLSTIESRTGSFATTSSVNNLQSVTGSYATTGSNQFNGNQSISGSITSNGTITAQTLVVQTVTSSIEFVTGSTRNGSLSSNAHEFTGSVSITGSATTLLSVNNSVLFVSASRNIGIGTSTPDRPLDVYSSTVLGIARIRGNSSNGVALTIQNDENAQGISIYAAGTSGFGLSGWAGNTALESETGIVYSAYSGSHIFQNSNRTERMRITSAGNVGIGNISPATRLHVQGASTGALTAVTYFHDTSVNKNGLAIRCGTGRVDLLATFDGTAIGTDLTFTPTTIGGAQNEAVRITSAGNVGIGTTNPSTKLHVNGVISANELILAGGSSWGYTTDSNWSSHQLIIPSGTLAGGGVYLIRIQWTSGSSPYIVYATGIWQPVQSNGGSADVETLLTTSSHQGVGIAIYIRNQSVGGQITSALYARLSNFASTVGSLTATATRLM